VNFAGSRPIDAAVRVERPCSAVINDLAMASRSEEAIGDVRQANISVAVAVIEGGSMDLRVDPGADPVSQDTLFEIGSLTKTLTALLLADMVLGDEAALETTVGEVVAAGDNGGITLGHLATHTSGLPRIPHNLMAKASLTPDDPYCAYDADDLLADLQGHPVKPGAPEYSNYGYMLLGLVLAKLGGQPFSALLTERVLRPLGMNTATLDAESDAPDRRVQGYRNNAAVPHWSKLLPGAGGAEASIKDMAAYLDAELNPAASELEIALEMTQRPLPAYDECLGWQRAGAALWHNGGTGGFSSFLGFDRSQSAGVVILTNTGGGAPSVDRAGFRTLGITNPLVDG
jgi:CubicO group peptidase (beta-lactamase class C family)